ncbi:MAG: bacteriohemerythrin [Thermodesulfovibrionales bacterium]
MKLQWSSEFSVHDDEIDRHHRELFLMINNLDDAMRQGRAGAEVLKVLDFLDQYIILHFRSEEQRMTGSSYPSYEDHRNRHLWFRGQLSDIRKKLETEGPTPDVIVQADHLLITWFSNHVRTLDMRLGNFLKEGR